MGHLGARVILGASLALSGCAAGAVGLTKTASELRLLTETVTSAPRVVLAAGSAADSERQPALKGQMIDVALRESNAPPSEDAPRINEQSSSGDALWADDQSSSGNAPQLNNESPFHDEPAVVDESPLDEAPPPGDEPSLDEAVVSDSPTGDGDERLEADTPTMADTAEDTEEIATPGPLLRSPSKPDAGENDRDRFSRRVVDVPLDIRPTQGDMPDDLAAKEFGKELTIDETWPSDEPSDEPADIYCSYTPWTICYRPLYFEDIRLERYGNHVGYLQSGLSGVRFFSQIAALPYKMTVHPPRSCQCSNGFSRRGDCPLSGYGHREFRWDASLVEAAAVAGVVYILP